MSLKRTAGNSVRSVFGSLPSTLDEEDPKEIPTLRLRASDMFPVGPGDLNWIELACPEYMLVGFYS